MMSLWEFLFCPGIHRYEDCYYILNSKKEGIYVMVEAIQVSAGGKTLILIPNAVIFPPDLSVFPHLLPLSKALGFSHRPEVSPYL